MNDKEKEFTSFDSQGPTDIDVVGFHLDTIDDILRLIKECHTIETDPLACTSEKLDELRHYTLKLKRYVEKRH